MSLLENIAKWTKNSAAIIRSRPDHVRAILAFDLAGDAQRLLSSHIDGSLLLWDLRTDDIPRKISVADKPITALALVEDGSIAATVSSENTAKLWNIATGECFAEIPGSYSCVTRIDGRGFALGGMDGRVSVCGTEGVVYACFGDGGGVVGALANAGDLIVIGGQNREVQLMHLTDGRISWRATKHVRSVDAAAFSPDRNVIATGSKDGAVIVWDVASGKVRHEFRGHQTHVSALAFYNGGRNLASGGYDGSTGLWDVRSGATLQMLTLHRHHVTGLAARPDGTLVSSGAEGTLVVFSSDTGKPVMTFGEDQRVARRELLRHFVLEQTAFQFEAHSPRLAVRPQKWIGFCLTALARMPHRMLRLLRGRSLHLLTKIALEKGNYELTVNLAAEWIRRDPTSPTAWMRLGNAFQALQEYPAALAAFDMATTLADEINCIVHRQKIRALEIVARGDTRLYRDVLGSAYAVDRSLPGNVAVLHTLAEAHAALGNYDAVNKILGTQSYKQAKLLYHGNIYFDQLLLWLANFRANPDQFVPPLDGSTRPSYLIAFVVWGNSFHEVMEQITLPCLLASGNLPYLSLVGSVRIVFLTPENEVRRVEEMPILAELRRYSQCEIVAFPPLLTSFPDKYKLMSALHVAALTISRRDKSHFIFLAPDIVFADNYLETLDRYRASGKGIVMVGGIMLELTGFRRALNWKPDNAASPLSLSPSTLLELGLQHLHHVSVKNFYATEMDRSSASIIFWPLHDGGLVAHGFHHTPYLISSDVLARYDGSFFLTIDSDFLNHIVKNENDLNDCVVISDARETNYFELSRPERSDTHYICNNEVIVRWGSVQGIAARWLFEKRVDFAPQGVQDDDPVVIASDKIVKEILAEIDIRKHLISPECGANS